MASPFLLRLSNTLVFLFFLGSNLYASFGPDHEDLYGKHPTYLTPAPYAFAVWGAIHTLLGGFIIWQWLPGTEEIVVNAFGSWFAIAGLLSAIQLDLWDSDRLVLSLIVLLFASAAVSIIYYNLSTSYPPESFVQHIFVHTPISLFHGWLVFIFWLNLLAIISKVKDPSNPGLFDGIVTVFVLFQLAGQGVAYTEYKYAGEGYGGGDIGGAAVIAWALFAVSSHQPSALIHWTSLILGVYVVIHGLFRPAQHQYKLRSVVIINSENAPLLGQEQV
ncbi:hypothetical protein HDV05_005995 [Chytridiales sp. JEL 0842]|nr:hypothetical protein HDV05_005995 [Chytridiales sp. JEL 0842]